MINAPDTLIQLVERFERNLDQYTNIKYKEENLKNEFINPFFEALGWDVYNKNDLAPAYKDVEFEDSLKVGKKTKAPDYCFKLGKKRIFFVEAKKPAIDIRKDVKPASQLRSYAWNAKLPISILTDFEEFAVYTSRRPPKKGDKASTERIRYWTFNEYVEKWEEIYNLFSKEAIINGSFDKFAEEEVIKKRGTKVVDDEFLDDIERWREDLAKNIRLRNQDLPIRSLNYAVQSTIDRIIFLRMAEGRGIERYEQLLDLTKKEGIYSGLCKIFELCDKKYNSGLFYFKKEIGRMIQPDDLTLKLEIDDIILKNIFKRLYPPDGPYLFTVIPPEILGNVYEQFLGKKIVLKGKQSIKIDEKPEVKKSGGVYYTPKYIVDYIVENTMGEICKKKKIGEIEKLKIVDPACGSGSFLLGAYSFLLEYYLEYYLDKKNKKKYKHNIFKGITGDWRLTLEEKKRILLNNIYGVDIDSQAVEVTKLSLLLKVLEGEGQQKLIPQRLLPDLSNNIKCGNSLISPDFYSQQKLFDDDEINRINVFDWKFEFKNIMDNGGFDVVISNPPYIQIQKLQEFYPDEINYYKKKYNTASEKNVDIYIPFIERSLSLLRKNGVMGFICPNRFFNSEYGNNLRELIKKYNIYHLINFRHYFVFKKADTYTCLLFIQNNNQQSKLAYKELRNLYKGNEEIVQKYLFELNKSENNFITDEIAPHFIDQEKWYFMTENENHIFKRLINNPKFNTFYDEFFVGIQTSLDKIYILQHRGEQNNYYKLYSRFNEEEFLIEKEILRPIIDNNNICSYSVNEPNYFVIFPYKIIDKNAILYSENEMKKMFPKTWDYFTLNKKKIQDRERGKFKIKDWYKFGRDQNISKQHFKKILIPHVVKNTIAAIDINGNYCLDNVGANGIILKEKVKEHPNYFLAILNSPISTFFISKISIFLSGGFYATNKQFAGDIPIKKIDYDNKMEVELYNKIIEFVDNILYYNGKINENLNPNELEILNRQKDAIHNQINQNLYKLYGFSNEEEIRIIESVVI